MPTTLKGQSHEIFEHLFLHQTSPPRPLIHTLKNSFEKSCHFAKIVEFQIANDTAESWLSGVNGTPLSHDLVVPGVIDTAESKPNMSQWK